MDDQDNKENPQALADEELDDVVAGRHGGLSNSYDRMRANLKHFLDNGGTLEQWHAGGWKQYRSRYKH